MGSETNEELYKEYLANMKPYESFNDYLKRVYPPVNTFRNVDRLYPEEENEGQDPEYYEDLLN